MSEESERVKAALAECGKAFDAWVASFAAGPPLEASIFKSVFDQFGPMVDAVEATRVK